VKTKHTEPISWSHSSLRELSAIELFEIFKLRQEVFILEQTCLYPDMDDTDLVALHLCGRIDQQLALYARVIPPGVTYPYASIGRIVTAPNFRGSGFGKPLVSKAIELIEQQFGNQKIKIGAQSGLQDFYHNWGFVTVSEEYIEDGIAHIDMLRDAKQS
jgi:ElaA protein